MTLWIPYFFGLLCVASTTIASPKGRKQLDPYQPSLNNLLNFLKQNAKITKFHVNTNIQMRYI